MDITKGLDMKTMVWTQTLGKVLDIRIRFGYKKVRFGDIQKSTHTCFAFGCHSHRNKSEPIDQEVKQRKLMASIQSSRYLTNDF